MSTIKDQLDVLDDELFSIATNISLNFTAIEKKSGNCQASFLLDESESLKEELKEVKTKYSQLKRELDYLEDKLDYIRDDINELSNKVTASF